MVIKLSQKARTHLDSLTARQKDLYHASGVFAPDGDFSALALLTVQQGEALAEDDLEKGLADVAALAPNLIVGDAPHYRHTSQNARNYALRELEKNKRADDLLVRHVAYYREKTRHSLPPSDDPVALESESAQLRHAINWTAQNSLDDLPGLVLIAGAYLANERAYRAEVREWLSLALEYAESIEAADDLRVLGDLCVQLRHTDAAHAFYQLALQGYGEASLAGQAHTYKGLGDLCLQDNDRDAALQHYHRAFVLYEVMDFALGQANTLRQMGALQHQLGDPGAAHENLRRAVALYSDLGFEFELANGYRAVADLNTAQGELSDANDNYERAFALYGQLGFESEQAGVLLAMGDMHMQADHLDRAKDHYERALSLFAEAGDRLGQADAHRALGNLHLELDEHDAARECFQAALDRYEQLGADHPAAIMLQMLAALHLNGGDEPAAAATIFRAMPLLDSLDDPLLGHELQTGMRGIVREIGADFKTHWDALSEEPPPEWLVAGDDPDDIPFELMAALASNDDLHQALEDDPLLLDHLSRVPIPRRAEWLEDALTMCPEKSTDARVRRHRAMLLKEIAGLPGQNVNDRLTDAIAEFDVALDLQANDAAEYALTQKHRVALLRDMAGMSGVNRAELLYRAKGGCDAALEKLKSQPIDFAHMQLVYAHLLREMAGLRGEDRPARMLQALEVYDAALAVIIDTPLQHATAQSNRASLLQEIAGLPDEDESERLREALSAAADSVVISAQVESQNYTPIAKRVMANIRQSIIQSYDAETFDQWWLEIVGLPQPEWVLTA